MELRVQVVCTALAGIDAGRGATVNLARAGSCQISRRQRSTIEVEPVSCKCTKGGRNFGRHGSFVLPTGVVFAPRWWPSFDRLGRVARISRRQPRSGPGFVGTETNGGAPCLAAFRDTGLDTVRAMRSSGGWPRSPRLKVSADSGFRLHQKN